MKVWPGSPYPLGATWDGIGVNFALFSEHATSVELCLFDSPYAGRESHRIPLRQRTEQVWHGYLPEVRPGQLYGYRVHGPYDLRAGHRFNPAKLVFDPYAKAIGRNVRWHDSMFGFTIGAPDSRDDRDNAAYAPLASVIDPAFTWGDDRPIKRPWHETVIYELHVRGFTKRHPGIPDDLRGSYLGPGLGSRHRSPPRPRGDGCRAAARPPPHRRLAPGAVGALQLLGLQHAGLLRARAALLGRADPPTARCGSSSRSCGRCTRPASR